MSVYYIDYDIILYVVNGPRDLKTKLINSFRILMG